METVERSSGLRPLRIGAAVVGLVVIVVALLAANRGSAVFDESTPEGAVQRYVAAVLERDYVGAAEMLSDELRSNCTAADFARTWVPDSARVTLRDVVIDGKGMLVSIRITEVASNRPFETYEHAQDTTFVLTRLDGGWVIVDTPWPLYQCNPGR